MMFAVEPETDISCLQGGDLCCPHCNFGVCDEQMKVQVDGLCSNVVCMWPQHGI